MIGSSAKEWRPYAFSLSRLSGALALAVLAGACASPQIIPANDPGGATTIQEARGFIKSAMTGIEEEKKQIVRINQYARVGTFVGTLGVGAAALASLHKDAAIGFATLAALSSQGLPLAGPPIWMPFCEEANAALRCLSGVADRLGLKLRDLKTGITMATAVESEYTALEAARGGRTIPVDVTREVRAMRLAALDAGAEVSKEGDVAEAVYQAGKEIVSKLNELLWKNQPSIASFQIAATSIIGQATAAGTPPPSPPPSGATTKGGPSRSGSMPGISDEKISDADFALMADDVLTHARRARSMLDGLLQAKLGDEILKGGGTNECKARLVGAVLPISVNDAAKSEITLGNGQEKTVLVSGGTGIYLGTWVDTNPPAALIEPPSLPSMGGFKFKQLKKQAAEQKLVYRIWDSANSQQSVEIKIKVPAEN